MYKAGLYKVLTVLLLMVAWMALITYWVIPQGDDLVFMHRYMEINNGSETITVNGLVNFANFIGSYDNRRLANIMSPVFSLQPFMSAIYPLLTGLCLALMGWVCARCSSKHVTWPSVIVAWALLLIMLPWRSSINVHDFQLNYVWGTAVTAAWMLWMFHHSFHIDTRHRLKSCFIVSVSVVFATIAGAWHEGFTMPMTAGLILAGLLGRSRRTLIWWAIVAYYGVVSLWVYMCDGMLNRTGDSLLMFRVDFRSIVTLYPLIIACGALLLARACRRDQFRSMLRDDTFLAWVASAIVLVSIYLLMVFNNRSLFWLDYMCCVVILRCCLMMSPVLKKITKWLAAVLVLVVSVTTLVWQQRLYMQDKEILSQLAGQNGGTLFRDIIGKNDLPPYALRIPETNTWLSRTVIEGLKNVHGYTLVAVVPEALRNADPQVDSIISGTAGVRCHEGYFYTLLDSNDNNGVRLLVSTDESKSPLYEVIPSMEFESSQGQRLTLLSRNVGSLRRATNVDAVTD